VFADGAHLDEMLALAQDPLVAGFTTNPTLMRKSGVTDYGAFARTVLDACANKPVSFEVLADDFEEMERQARTISSWADNVYVKVPITNTRGESSAKLIERLSTDGIKVNVTAIMTLGQVRSAADAMEASPGGVVSVFAGRLADTGRDPIPLMRAALALLEAQPRLELLWASPREVLNVVQADEIGCHIITVTKDLLAKLQLLGKDPVEFSAETVAMFHSDALAAGLTL
jgi:transaldolase